MTLIDTDTVVNAIDAVGLTSTEAMDRDDLAWNGVDKEVLYRVLPMPSGRNGSTAAFDYDHCRPSGRLPLETRFDRAEHVAALAQLAQTVERSWEEAVPAHGSSAILSVLTSTGGDAVTLLRLVLRQWCNPSTPVPIQSPSAQFPEEVLKFIIDHDIMDCFRTAIDLVLQAFPNIRLVAARLQPDPDTDDVRVVIDVTVDAGIPEVLAAKKKYTHEWVRACPPAAREKIRLLYHMA